MQHLQTTLSVSRPLSAGGLALILAGAALSMMGGCTAEVETAHPVVVAGDDAPIEAETVPAADVSAYPHTEYRGRVVYFVNGRWYYPEGRRWYYYRREPPELIRHRRHVEQAPPAHRVYDPRADDAVRVR